jgi:hypothetical protein
MMTSASPVLVPREDPVGKIVFAVVALAFGLVCFVSLMILLAAVLRGPTERCRTSLREAPLQAFMIGVLGYAALSALAWYFLSGAFIRRILETEIVPSWLAAGIVVVTVLAMVSLIGAAGTVTLLGERLAELRGKPMSGLRRTALATVLAVLASWFPVVGWLVVAPMLLILSFGAATLAVWRSVRLGVGAAVAQS